MKRARVCVCTVGADLKLRMTGNDPISMKFKRMSARERAESRTMNRMSLNIMMKGPGGVSFAEMSLEEAAKEAGFDLDENDLSQMAGELGLGVIQRPLLTQRSPRPMNAIIESDDEEDEPDQDSAEGMKEEAGKIEGWLKKEVKFPYDTLFPSFFRTISLFFHP